MNEQKRIALCANVCRDGTPIEHQFRELESMAAKKGWQIVGQFVDTESSTRMNFVPALTAYAMPWSDTFGLAGSERGTGQAATKSITLRCCGSMLLMGLLGH